MNILSICILHVSRLRIDKILNSKMANAESEVRSQCCKNLLVRQWFLLLYSILSLSVANLVAIGNKLFCLLCSQQRGAKNETSPQIMPFVYYVHRQIFVLSCGSKSAEVVEVMEILQHLFVSNIFFLKIKIMVSL